MRSDMVSLTVKAFSRTSFVLFAACLFTACASAPPQAPVPVSAPAEAAPPVAPPPPPPPLPLANLICGVQEARRVEWADLGVPEGSRPLDVALGKDTVWVLFDPPLLVGVPREARTVEPVAIPEFGAVEELLDQIPGPPGSAWHSLALDPFDGSVWIASSSAPTLWRMRPGRRPAAVRITPAPPAGSGGFADLLAGRGSVWAAPACAPSAAPAPAALLRLEPSGKVRGTALPQSGGCEPADLERDWSGADWVLRPVSGEVLRLRFDGTWEPAGDALAAPAPAPAGSPPVRSWFFWGNEPLGLGGDAEGGGTLLYRRVDGKVAAFREDCGAGNALVRVAGDRQGWAALTRQWLLLGGYSPGLSGN